MFSSNPIGIEALRFAVNVGSLNNLVIEKLIVVAQNGNDATGQRNRPDKPFRTIDAALSVAQPDDLIYVAPGNYTMERAIEQHNLRIILDNATVTAIGRHFIDLLPSGTTSVSYWLRIDSYCGRIILNTRDIPILVKEGQKLFIRADSITFIDKKDFNTIRNQIAPMLLCYHNDNQHAPTHIVFIVNELNWVLEPNAGFIPTRFPDIISKTRNMLFGFVEHLSNADNGINDDYNTRDFFVRVNKLNISTKDYVQILPMTIIGVGQASSTLNQSMSLVGEITINSINGLSINDLASLYINRNTSQMSIVQFIAINSIRNISLRINYNNNNITSQVTSILCLIDTLFRDYSAIVVNADGYSLFSLYSNHSGFQDPNDNKRHLFIAVNGTPKHILPTSLIGIVNHAGILIRNPYQTKVVFDGRVETNITLSSASNLTSSEANNIFYISEGLSPQQQSSLLIKGTIYAISDATNSAYTLIVKEGAGTTSNLILQNALIVSSNVGANQYCVYSSSPFQIVNDSSSNIPIHPLSQPNNVAGTTLFVDPNITL